MNVFLEWRRTERAWAERPPPMTERDYWFLVEGMLKSLWFESPAPGRVRESTVPTSA